jgi:UDPglucose--hexose-1-phosphate uridylyltransferase
MPDFKFIEIPKASATDKNFKQWVVLASKRAKRPHVARSKSRECVFCPGHEKREEEVYRIGGKPGDKDWRVRVFSNKYPFAPIHDVVIHTPNHTERFTDLSVEEIRLVLEAYVNRFNAYQKSGQVVIFANSGNAAGESIGHSHSQIAVVPGDVNLFVPALEKNIDYRGEHFSVKEFDIMCPPFSQWPDEVWIVPKERNKTFGEVTVREIESLASVLQRIVRIFELRHGHDFPHNYYIYPHSDWYLRLVPRAKALGGFEISTGIFVNTQDPSETIKFIKNHFFEAVEEKIKKSRAEYRRGV